MSSLSELKIKTNIVKRLFKEEQYYIKEVTQLKEKLEKYKTSPDYDEYDAKQMQRGIDETEVLIPDCKARLNAATNDLVDLVKNNYDEGSDKNPDEILEATKVLQSIIIN